MDTLIHGIDVLLLLSHVFLFFPPTHKTHILTSRPRTWMACVFFFQRMVPDSSEFFGCHPLVLHFSFQVPPVKKTFENPQVSPKPPGGFKYLFGSTFDRGPSSSTNPPPKKKHHDQVLCRNDFDKKILLLLDALWERNKLQEAPMRKMGPNR